MAQIETRQDVLREWKRDKQANEQRMLERLNKLFQYPVATEHVRRVVRYAFEQMRAEEPSAAVWGALADERFLSVWKRLDTVSAVPQLRLGPMLNKLYEGPGAPDPLDCNDLSELIRVIGAWLEKGGGGGGIDINKAYRPGVGKIPRSTPHAGPGQKGKATQQQDALDKKIWQGKKVDPKTKEVLVQGVRNREERRKPGNYIPIEAHVATHWVRPKFDGPSGLQFFRVNENDLCKRIDLLFGLLKGATISGTTTDTAMVLEAFGWRFRLHAGYYLFPVATIAASLHHTLIEAGLALSLVGAIETYQVGFYTSLIPKGGLPPELCDAEKILKEGEEDPKNRHFILWYGDQGNEDLPAGGILFDKKFEQREFKRLTEGKGLMTHVMRLPRIPNKMDVARFIDLMAPNLLTYIRDPDFQPERFRSRG